MPRWGEVDVLGEEVKDAAHYERRDHFGSVIFSRDREGSEVLGNVAGDAGGYAAGI